MIYFNKIMLFLVVSVTLSGCRVPVHYQKQSDEIPNFPVTKQESGRYWLNIVGLEKLSIDYMLESPIKASLKLDQKESFTKDTLVALRQRYGDVELPGVAMDSDRRELVLEVKQARVFATCGSISMTKGTCTAEGKVVLALALPGQTTPVTAIGEEVITSPPNGDILEPLHDVGPKALRRAQAKALTKLITVP